MKLYSFFLLISLGFMGMPALGLETCRLEAAYLEHNELIRPAIGFYNRGERYYELTNFYQLRDHRDRNKIVPIEIDRQEWQTSEHYFQAQKFIDFRWKTVAQDEIRAAKTPREAFYIARRYDQLKRADWDQVKDNVMLTALRAKFKNQHLKNVLLGTENKILIETSPYDGYWGCGPDGKGQNKLGKLLMLVREEIGGTRAPAWVKQDLGLLQPTSAAAVSVAVPGVRITPAPAVERAEIGRPVRRDIPEPKSFWGSLSKTLWSDQHIVVKAAILGCVLFGIKLLYDRA